MVTIRYSIVYLKLTMRADLKCSHHVHVHTHTAHTQWLLCEGMDLLANLIMVIISQHIIYQIITYTLNLHNVICQLYLNKAGERKEISEWI